MSYDNLNDQSIDDENCNLIINYIPSSMSENDILEVFKQHGDVTNFKLVCDKISHVSLGYAFCKYSNVEDAQNAINKLNGSKLLDKTLKVSISKKKPEQTTLYVAGYPFSFTKEDLEGIFVVFGAIKESKLLFQPDGKSKGVGFITFENGTSAFNALALNGVKPPNCPKPFQVRVFQIHLNFNNLSLLLLKLMIIKEISMIIKIVKIHTLNSLCKPLVIINLQIKCTLHLWVLTLKFIRLLDLFFNVISFI